MCILSLFFLYCRNEAVIFGKEAHGSHPHVVVITRLTLH